MDLVDALNLRSATLQGTEAGCFVAAQAEALLAKVEAAYARLYRDEMLASYKRHRPAWDALLAREHVTLVCFCPDRAPGQRQRHTCHRGHLAGFMTRLGAVDGGEVELPQSKPSRVKPVPPAVLFAVTGSRPPKPELGPEASAHFSRIIKHVDATVRALPRGTVVVHGGARGVDEAAGVAAREAGHEQVVYASWFDAWGKGAPLARNPYVMTADRVGAWPSSWGTGTQRAIELAHRAGCRVEVADVHG